MHGPRTHAVVDDATLTPNVRSALRREVEALKRRDEVQRANLRRLENELKLAASVQRNLHSPPPTGNGVDFHALYRPADVISGDTYEVVRLDESRVAVALADATGHGLPAGLLSVFVKRSLRGKEAAAGGCRVLDPDEVLARANADILGTQLQECL
ncbi:MAG: SpoIIE family protein phosphatase, partial [Phycisphaerae bacterium]